MNMPHSSFEAVVGNQFSPHVERYYDFGLHDRYPGIEPNSALGRMAVEVEDALLEGQEALDESFKYTSEFDRILYADEIGAANDMHDIAHVRSHFFDSILRGMPSSLRSDRPITYEAAVAFNLERAAKELGKIWTPPGSEAELSAFSEEICLFLMVESNLHFRELAESPAQT